jgi:EpsI family protein
MNPVRVLVAAALIASTAALAHAVRQPGVVRAIDFSAFPYRVDAWTGRDAEPLDAETLSILGADAYLNRNYTATGAGAPVNLYVAYYAEQRPGVSIHSPLHCLPGTGWEPLDVATVDGPAEGGRPDGRMRRMLVRKNGDRAVVFYWYAIHGRILANELASKAWLLHDALRFGRTDAALVRIVVPVDASGDERAADRRASAFASEVLPYLQQLWS